MDESSNARTGVVLEAVDVSKIYGGVKALDAVSIQLRAGEVHCLAGENGSGKSTLIKILCGAEQPNSGALIVDGVPVPRMTPARAIHAGIQVIYQDFSLFPKLTVGENIVLTRAVADRKKAYNPKSLLPLALAIVEELGVELDLQADVESLSVADRQLTAICRALVTDASVIIMDEPTTALTHTEVERLFAIVRRLQDRGVAVVIVSHKLEEVFALSQHLTVLRNGVLVASGPIGDFDRAKLIYHMTGQELDESRHVGDLGTADRLMEVQSLGRSGAFEDVSFSLSSGEILGITGLLGSGRTEIAEALFGVAPAQRGEVRIGGRTVSITSIGDAIKAGIGYVPEDRLTQGLFLDKSIGDNITAASLGRHSKAKLLLDKGRISSTVNNLFQRLRIKAPTSAAPVRSLSGGNAQRVVVAKWLASQPKILILNGPTVGVDIGSKGEILDILRKEAAGGMGIILISDDLPELVAVCHRVLIVRHGRITDELRDEAIDVKVIHERIAA